MKRLRIAIVSDMIPGQPGGSFVSAMRFASLLNERGHRAIILAAKDSRQPAVSHFGNVPVYQFFSIPIPGSRRYYFFSLPREQEIRDIFAREHIDVVHIVFPSYSCFMAARVAKKMNIPIVTHEHTQPENVTAILPRFLKCAFTERLILKYLVWFVRRAKVVIIPSELGKNILKSGDQNLDIRVVSNGVDTSKFHPAPFKPFLDKNKIAHDRKIMLFVGRLGKEKNFETLLRSWPYILSKENKAHLIIIGKGPLENNIRSLAERLNIGQSVTFLDRVSDDDLLMAYNACELYVHPSLVELEGMVVLEAMACGKPVLIADSPTSASRYFVRENGLLFNPMDPRDLADKAIRILSDDDLRKKMSTNSLAEAKRYDIHESVTKLEDIYYSVIKTQRSIFRNY